LGHRSLNAPITVAATSLWSLMLLLILGGVITVQMARRN
jgi:hypothetical protein